MVGTRDTTLTLDTPAVSAPRRIGGRHRGGSRPLAIQRLTGYAIPITTSHDATGDGRNQMSDRSWKVCSQNVDAGTSISAGTRIDFGAVKLDESC